MEMLERSHAPAPPSPSPRLPFPIPPPSSSTPLANARHVRKCLHKVHECLLILFILEHFRFTFFLDPCPSFRLSHPLDLCYTVLLLQVVSRTFALLMVLMPLEAGAPDPLGMSEELSAARRRYSLLHLLSDSTNHYCK